jgi:hypothetical protein
MSAYVSAEYLTNSSTHFAAFAKSVEATDQPSQWCSHSPSNHKLPDIVAVFQSDEKACDLLSYARRRNKPTHFASDVGPHLQSG